jgi:hypothetical protein
MDPFSILIVNDFIRQRKRDKLITAINEDILRSVEEPSEEVLEEASFHIMHRTDTCMEVKPHSIYYIPDDPPCSEDYNQGRWKKWKWVAITEHFYEEDPTNDRLDGLENPFIPILNRHKYGYPYPKPYSSFPFSSC